MRANVHDEVEALLPAYVARTLPGVRRDLVAQHLRRCSLCQAEFSRLRHEPVEPVEAVHGTRGSLVRLALAAAMTTLVGWSSWLLRRRR